MSARYLISSSLISMTMKHRVSSSHWSGAYRATDKELTFRPEPSLEIAFARCKSGQSGQSSCAEMAKPRGHRAGPGKIARQMRAYCHGVHILTEEIGDTWRPVAIS